jgi:hypothetical protein
MFPIFVSETQAGGGEAVKALRSVTTASKEAKAGRRYAMER